MLIPAEEVAHLGRVARAAEVLEEKCVEERGARLRVEGQLLAETHAEHAGPQRMPLGLPLDEVQRVGEGRDDVVDVDGSGASGHGADP